MGDVVVLKKAVVENVWRDVTPIMRIMVNQCCPSLPEADRVALTAEIVTMSREMSEGVETGPVEVGATLPPAELAQALLGQLAARCTQHVFTALGKRLPVILLRASGGLKVESGAPIQH